MEGFFERSAEFADHLHHARRRRWPERLTDRPRLRKGDRLDLTNNPVFSPSGTKIIYTHCLPGRAVLKVMNPDGSRKRVFLAIPGFPNKADWGTHP
jgi:hypothetical protein